MRTKILNLVMPLAVVSLGFAGAVQNNVTEQRESKKAVATWGYKHVSAPQNCEAVQECDDNGGNFCTSDIDGAQLYALEGTNSCPRILMRVNP